MRCWPRLGVTPQARAFRCSGCVVLCRQVACSGGGTRVPVADRHPYWACRDVDCPRLACQAWREAWAEGHEEGYRDGHKEGYQEGWNDGFAAGLAAGLAECK